MKLFKSFSLVLLVLGLLVPVTAGARTPSLSSASGDTGLTLPELSIDLVETTGDVYVRYDTATEWVNARPGQKLGMGDRLRTSEASTAALKVPAIALVTVKESTVFEVAKLKRLREKQGLLISEENVTVNEINLDVHRGQVQNSLKRYENVETNYRLKTPNAVAGVRGTTFECDVSTQFTECTVFEGNIAFSNRFGTRREISLGALQRSRMTLDDTAPSDPESVEEEDVDDLEAMRDEARDELDLQPVLRGLSVNGNRVGPTGEGVYRTSVTVEEIDAVTLSGRAVAQESDANLESVAVRFEGERLEVDGLETWSTSIPLSELEEGRDRLNLVVQLTDNQGNRSRAYPVQIDLRTVREESGVLPPDLKQGTFRAVIQSAGNRLGSEISFPMNLSGEDFLNASMISDTRIDTVENLLLSGEFNADTPIAGVAYRYDGERSWRRLGTAGQWDLPVPLDRFRRVSSVSLELVGWTEDGYRSEITSVGPFQYDRSRSVLPISYSTGGVELRLRSIGGRSLSVSDLPDSFTADEIEDQTLRVEGSAVADSPIRGVAYSLDGGRTWSEAQGAENWTVGLPADESGEFNLRILAWTESNEMSSPVPIGPIYFSKQDQRSVLPTDYASGDVSVRLATLAGLSVSNIRFPYHLYRDDADGDGIMVTGEASASGTIEGVAYSLDGGKTWQRAQGAEDWTFYLPASSSRTYTPQVRAWTAEGTIGEAQTLEEINYTNSYYSTVIRNRFRELWNDFTNKNTRQFLDYFYQDFEYVDSTTGRSFTLNGFDSFISDFYSGIRNLNVFYDITQVLAGESGGEVQFSLEWRGKEDEADRPFVMFGERSLFKYRRANNGQFEIISFEGFPLILYLFNRREIRIPDLDGILIDTLEVVNKDDADIIAELMTPDFTVNKISIGGHVSQGGIKQLSGGSFSTVENLPALGSGYQDNVLIEEGRVYAMNIRDNFGSASTGLLTVRDLQSSFVEVQIISAQSPPGINEDVYRAYRGINPYD